MSVANVAILSLGTGDGMDIPGSIITGTLWGTSPQNESQWNESLPNTPHCLGPDDSSPVVDQDGVQETKDETEMILSAPKALTADGRMPYGPYKMERMEDVPCGFLNWLWNKKEFDRKSPVGLYIANNLSALETENKDLIWTP